MSGNPTINYEALAQDAMRGMVRTVLSNAAKSGLPGDHHFYISFYTQAIGVVLSKRLRERYPEEMTIVLQHRFWDLTVSDDRFDVKLTFDGIPERIIVPLNAIKVFFDPSVRYGFQFDEPETSNDGPADMALPADFDTVPPSNSPRASTARLPAPRKPRVVRKSRDKPGVADPSSVSGRDTEGQPAPPTETEAVEKSAEETPVAGGAEIVRLDAFRKR